MPINVLIVEDDTASLRSLERILTSDGYILSTASNFADAIEFLKTHEPDIIVSDMILPDIPGSELLKFITNTNRDIPIIFVTAYATIEDAVKQIKNGAFDYITKPIDINKLEICIERAIESKKLRIENIQLKEELKNKYSYKKIIGISPAVQNMLTIIEKISNTNATVLIRGESGTGKELVAEAIHYNSLRSMKPFITVNCAALTESIIESELFGHEKGAFTGAIKTVKGKFEIAHGGTLFLDEIGDISVATQMKLLRVLEEKAFQRVGGCQNLEVDIRIIAATNKNLEQEIKEGKFREELYYRLKVITIDIPALRERKEDIPLLIYHFIEKFNVIHNRNVSSVGNEAMNLLKEYEWRGNIRELRNLMESIIVLASSNIITINMLPSHIVNLVNNDYIKFPLGLPLKTVERQYLMKTLNFYSGNKMKTARNLSIGLKTLYRKIAESSDYRKIHE